MKTMRLIFLLLLTGSISVYAENSVRVYVPADSLHGAQQLRAGHPGEIFIEITNDQPLSAVYLEIIEEKYPASPNQRYWNNLYASDVEYPLPLIYFHDRYAFLTAQSNYWPDTLGFELSDNLSSYYLPIGTHQIIKLTVFPIYTGIVAINPGSITFVNSYGINLDPPTFQSEPITIIEDYDCNGNGIPDNDEIKDDYRLDCDGNNLLDVCEGYEDCNSNGIADACDFDCNLNGIADECEPYDDCNCNGIDDALDISSGAYMDINNNSIPDDCDDLPDFYYRFVIKPNERHGQGVMHYGYPEEIYVFAFTQPDTLISASVFYGEFQWSTPEKLWHLSNSLNLTPSEHFQINGINYHAATVNAPDSVIAYNISLGNYFLSPGYFPVCKLEVIPSAAGTVSVKNYIDPINQDSSVFVLEPYELMYAPIIGNDIIITEYPDCNHNGILDSIDIANGLINDCNNNFIADYCEVDSHPESDCNNNHLVDECEIAANPDLDCDGNGLLDICDITADSSLDCNGNNILDNCEINSDVSLDCNNNLLLDLCEIEADPSLDCNNNNALDACDIFSGTSGDCNFNMIPDDCEYDCNLNGIPDDCETMLDCNCNNQPDNVDVQSGWSNDNNSNGTPDECEGIDGDYIRIYAITPEGDLTTDLPLYNDGDIIFALTTGPGADAVSIPISPLSSDNSRLWETLSSTNVEFLHKRFLNFTSLSQLSKQFSTFPDSLYFSVARGNPTPLYDANSTIPILRLTVTPIKQDMVNWAPFSFPPATNFTYVNTIDKIEHPLSLRYDPISISCCRLMRGNIDYDLSDEIDIADLIYLVEYQFGNPTGPQPFCFDEADIDDSGTINIADLVYLVAYQFLSGAPPLDCK